MIVGCQRAGLHYDRSFRSKNDPNGLAQIQVCCQWMCEEVLFFKTTFLRKTQVSCQHGECSATGPTIARCIESYRVMGSWADGPHLPAGS